MSRSHEDAQQPTESTAAPDELRDRVALDLRLGLDARRAGRGNRPERRAAALGRAIGNRALARRIVPGWRPAAAPAPAPADESAPALADESATVPADESATVPAHVPDPADPPAPAAPAAEPRPAWLTAVPRRTATTGEGRDRRWVEETDVGIVDYGVPARGDRAAPHGERRDVEFVYTSAQARDAVATDDPAVVAACDEVNAFRDRIVELAGLRASTVGFQTNSAREERNRYVKRGYVSFGREVPLVTSLEAEESFRLSPIALPAGVTREQLHQARLDVWHDLSGNEGSPASVNAYDSANLTWGGGFAAVGQLQKIVTRAFELSPTMRSLFERAGMTVSRFEETGSLEFCALDTDRRWQLVGDDAERYIRTDRRLLSLLGRIGSGTVADDMLTGDAAAENRRLANVLLDAQFVQLIQAAARLVGSALTGNWTRQTRAAVAHSLHAGGLANPGFWNRVGRESDGSPEQVLRVLVDGWLRGENGTVDARRGGSHAGRVLGAASHGAFRETVDALPEVELDADDGQFIKFGRGRDLHKVRVR